MKENTINCIKNMCTGCRACEQICPKNAIKMIENKEGFFYPCIDENQCINCGLCKNVCHTCKDYKVNYNQKVYGIKSKLENLSHKSTSAGLAYMLSEFFLINSGVVCGASYEDNLDVKHIIIEGEEELYKLRGSKYVISDTRETFSEIKTLLSSGRKVLYTGTACQIAGLKSFLQKDYSNLYTVDIVCHGVPSLKVFKKYIMYLENKMRDKVVEYDFRNKEKTKWGLGFCAKVKTINSEKFLRADFDPYYHNFLTGSLYRESCYQCKYANIDIRPADITIGDFWGIEKIQPDFFNENGVSLCIINNDKGLELINFIEDKIIKEEFDKESAIKENLNLIRPTYRPEKRNNIYNNIDEMDSESYIKTNLTIDRSIKKYIKNLIPGYVKKIYKTKFKKS